MADDTTITAGSGGDVIGSDHVSSLNGAGITPGPTTPKIQRVKLTTGADGTANDVSTTNPVPTLSVGAATSAVTNVAASATTVTLKALNTGRKALSIFNAGTSNLFVKLGATATTTTSYTVMVPPNGYYELPDDPIYTGVVDGIWTATGGNGANVTELT